MVGKNNGELTVSSEASQFVAVQRRETPSLSANFTWTFLGNTVHSVGQWAMLVLLAKLTQPELVGQYALGLAIVLPVLMSTNLQLRNVVATDLQEQIQFGYYLGFRLLST